MYNVSFAEAMPQMEIVVPNLTAVRLSNGSHTLSGDAIIPT